MASSGLMVWFSSIFGPILNPILSPLLKLNPLLSIVILTFIITLTSTLIYKKVTDQEVIKSLKSEMKELRNQMKEFKDDIKKVEELQKKSLEKSMVHFKHTMKPMFITMIPILIIFSWFYAHLAYLPITPGQDFTTSVIFNKAIDKDVELIVPEGIDLISNSKQTVIHTQTKGWIFTHDLYYVNWTLKGKEGEYVLVYNYNNQEYKKDLLITNDLDYKKPSESITGSDIKEIKIDNQEMKIFGLRWFWIYFILAIIFNSTLRKIFKVQ